VSADSFSDKTSSNVILPAGSSSKKSGAGSKKSDVGESDSSEASSAGSSSPGSSPGSSSPGSSPAKSAEERLRFIKHKGHAIFLIEFSHCHEKELLFLLEQVKNIVARHEHGSLLTLVDFTGTHVDKNVATRMKEVLVLDRPFVKKSAWIGAESVPHVFYENFKSFSQRDLPVFKTREEAMDWLVAD
jgi:hypothetical protein